MPRVTKPLSYILDCSLFQTNHKELHKAKMAELKGLPESKTQTTLKFPDLDLQPHKQQQNRSSTYPRTGDKHKQLTNGLVDMVAECMLPLSVVESNGFRQFMSLLDPKFDVPSRRTVTRNLTSSLQSMKSAISDDLQQIMSIDERHSQIHATIDLWSSRAMDPIIGVRFHYMDEKFKIHVRTVAFKHFGERHTGVNIAAAFEEVLAEYGIPLHRFGYQICDNASNMIKAFDLFSMHALLSFLESSEEGICLDHELDHLPSGDSDSEDDLPLSRLVQTTETDFTDLVGSASLTEATSSSIASDTDDNSDNGLNVGTRLPCVAHSLQLVLKDAIKTVPLAEKVLKECNAVVVFFHRSLYWGSELKKLTGGKTLLAAVVTRWNSNLIMLHRLSSEDVWKSVGEVLAHARTTPGTKAVPRFTVSRSQLRDLVLIFQPFEEATNALQGDGVTVSSVIPALLGLDNYLAKLHTQFSNLQQSLRNALNDRFAALMTKEEYVIATILDCRYKLTPFLDNPVGTSGRPGPRTNSVRVECLKSVTRGEARRVLSSAYERARSIPSVEPRYRISYHRLTGQHTY
jgi:hypothetical protein